jgi:hypothetical protein
MGWDYAPTMDEQASFEPRAVLGRRRAGWNRLAIVVPALLFAVIAWAGVNGPQPESETSARAIASSGHAGSAAEVLASPLLGVVDSDFPASVVGLEVQRIGDILPQALGRDEVIAVAGWYVATAITDCPPLAAIYRPAALPEIRGDADSWAFCDRSGTLYASRPDLGQRMAATTPQDNAANTAGLPAVPATLVIGVVVPAELEIIGTQATPVVVVGRFVDSNAGCGSPAVCHRALAIDHVAWANGHETEQVEGDGSLPASGQPRLPADGVNALTGG